MSAWFALLVVTALLVVGRSLLGFLLFPVVLRAFLVTLGTVPVLAAALGVLAVVPAVVIALAVARAVVPVGTVLATTFTAILIVTTATTIAAPVVIATVLLATLTAIIAAAVAAGALVIAGNAGFAAILAGLVPTLFTPVAVGVAAGFLLRFFAPEEARDLLAQFAEQAFFLLSSSRWRSGCRCWGWRRGADSFHGGLFAHRFLGTCNFYGCLFLTLAVLLSYLMAGDMLWRGFVLAQAQNLEVRRFHVGHRCDHNRYALTGFNVGQLLAFFVQQEGGHRNRHHGSYFCGLLLGGFFVDQAHDAQRQRFDTPDGALAFTARANFAAGLAQ